MAIDQITTGIIKDDAVTAAKIPAGAVVADIATGGITTAKLAADAVDGTKLADNAVDSEHITNTSIDTAHLGNLQVTTGKMAADAIDGTKLADNAVNSEHITALAIDTAHVGNDQITGAKIENNPTIAGNLTVAGGLVPSTPLSHRNMIINGAMNVAQRNTSNLNTGGVGYTTVDRIMFTNNGGDNFDFTQSDITGASGGLTKAWKIVNDVNDTSIFSTHSTYATYKVEAQDFIRVRNAAGTGTVPFTLSFYAKVSTGTGTYSVSIDLPDTSSSANSRYTTSFTVSNANWNRYEINVPANSVGVVNKDNGSGLEINWIFTAGSNFTGGTTGAWAISSSTNNMSVSGQTQLWSGATGRSFELTGVQLELGSNATPFEHRSYADELLRCQRYHVRLFIGYRGAKQNGTAYLTTSYELPVDLRAQPVMTPTSGSIAQIRYNAYATISSFTPVLSNWSQLQGQSVILSWNGFSGGNDNRSAVIGSNTIMTFDCEIG